MNRKRSFQELELADSGLPCEALQEQEVHTHKRSCIQCGATQTPQWRQGPAGPQTLCNACGVRYSRLTKKTRPKKNREPQMVDQELDEQSLQGNTDEGRPVLVTPFAEAAQCAPGSEHLDNTEDASHWGTSTPRRTITTSGHRHNSTETSQRLTHAHRQVEGSASPSAWQTLSSQLPANYLMIQQRAATPPLLSRLGSRIQSSTLPSNVAHVEVPGIPASLPASRRGSSAQDLLAILTSDVDLSNNVPPTQTTATPTLMAVNKTQPIVKEVEQDDELDCAAALSLLSMASCLPPAKEAHHSPETTAVVGNEQVGNSSAGSAAVGGSPGASTTGNEQPCSPGVISHIREDPRLQVPPQDLGLLHQLCERFDQSIRAMVAANAACSAVFQVLRHKQQEARAAQSAARLAANQLMKYAAQLGCTVQSTTQSSSLGDAKPVTLETDSTVQTSNQEPQTVTQEDAMVVTASNPAENDDRQGSAATQPEVVHSTTMTYDQAQVPRPAESASGDALETLETLDTMETDKVVCHVRQPSSQSNFTLVAVDNLQ